MPEEQQDFTSMTDVGLFYLILFWTNDLLCAFHGGLS